jgi:hypothetical protein
MEFTKKLCTLKEIADSLIQPIDRIRYIVRKKQIEPAAKVGNIGLFNEQQIAAIEKGCQFLQGRKQL